MVHLSLLVLQNLKSQLNVNSVLHVCYKVRCIALNVHGFFNLDLKPSSHRVQASETILYTGFLRRLNSAVAYIQTEQK